MSDHYKTIAEPTEGEYKEKGSKFIAYSFPVADENAVKERLEEVRKLHPKARHHCYAWRLQHDGALYRANDDGEPSGTAGRPILGQLLSFEVTFVLIVVVRYFGGTLLGASGLITAYKAAAAAALAVAQIESRRVQHILRFSCNYAEMTAVMNLIKRAGAGVLSQQFGETIVLSVGIAADDAPMLCEKLSELGSVVWLN